MNNFKQFFKINFINLFLVIMLMLNNKLFDNVNFIKYSSGFIIIFLYLIYLMTKNEIIIIKYLISYSLIVTTFVDYLFIYKTITIGFELKYIMEFIVIILSVKLITNYKKYIKIIKDPIFIIAIIAIILNLIYCIFNKDYSINDYLNGIRMYFRFIPVYIVLSYNVLSLDSDYYYYYYINLIIMIIQLFIGTGRDNINGIFGLIGTTTATIFLLILVVVNTIKYINKKIKLGQFIITIAGTLILFVIQENKSFLIITPFIVILLMLIKKANIIKKSFSIILSVLLMLGALKTILIVFPEVSNLINKDTYRIAIEEYFLKNNNPAVFTMGRFEALSYLNKLENNTLFKEMFGEGLGIALPSENWYYEGQAKKNMNGKTIFNDNGSLIYNKYTNKLGYHLSSVVVLFLETGWIGIISLILIILIILKKSIYLIIKTNEEKYNIWGAIGIVLCFSYPISILYVDGLQNRVFMLLNLILLGMINKNYILLINNKNIRII